MVQHDSCSRFLLGKEGEMGSHKMSIFAEGLHKNCAMSTFHSLIDGKLMSSCVVKNFQNILLCDEIAAIFAMQGKKFKNLVLYDEICLEKER